MLPNSSKMSDVCWGDEDIFVDPQNIPLLLYYFRSCLQATELLETSDKRRLLDTLLSRINSVLPEVKFEYYNGNIDYDIVDNLYDIINEIQFIELSFPDFQAQYYCGYDTYGNRLNRSPGKTKISPLKIIATVNEQKEACDSLIFKNKTSVIKPVGNGKNISNSTISKITKFIPTPILRKVHKTPDSLAVPLRSQSIYVVTNEDSRDVLINYYITSMKCLMLVKRYNKREVSEFNKSFCQWIEKEVIPYVSNHQYYPAFNGVLRIVKTMEDRGYANDCIDRINKRRATIVKKDRGKGDPNIISSLENLAHKGVTNRDVTGLPEYDEFLRSNEKGNITSLDSADSPSATALNSTTDTSDLSSDRLTTIFAFFLSLFLASWIIAGSLCIACFYRKRKSEICESELNTDSSSEKSSRGKSKHRNSCPYEKGEKVVIMMKDDGGETQCCYGTFHVDKTIPLKDGRPDTDYGYRKAFPVSYDDHRSASDMDSSETEQDYDLKSMSSRAQVQKIDDQSYSSIEKHAHIRRKVKSSDRMRYGEDLNEEREEYVEEYEEHTRAGGKEATREIEEKSSGGKAIAPHVQSAHTPPMHVTSSHAVPTHISPAHGTTFGTAIAAGPISSVTQPEVQETVALPQTLEKEESSATSDTSSTRAASISSGSSKAQLGSSHSTEPPTETVKICTCVPSGTCPHIVGGSKICPCSCSTGGSHYEYCQFKKTQASYEPLRSTNSVIIGESFTPATGGPSHPTIIEPEQPNLILWSSKDVEKSGTIVSTSPPETHSDYGITDVKTSAVNEILVGEFTASQPTVDKKILKTKKQKNGNRKQKQKKSL
ncbi:uncharacterized protein LOC142329549 [Lycorma delicatula]|uniref:uncharacterized protein LOC142329549 n=1 Tax=Lycorma delicatula TaxID=130591 RepID=UPI003F516348